MTVDQEYVAKLERELKASISNLYFLRSPFPNVATVRPALEMIAKEKPHLSYLSVAFGEPLAELFEAFLEHAQQFKFKDGRSLLTRLQSLRLANKQVGDESIKLLAKAAQAGHFAGLTTLDLSHTQVGDESIKVLAEAAQAGQLNRLESLDLRHTQVGDESIKLLAAVAKAGHLTNLVEFGLSHTNVGDEGVRHLTTAAQGSQLTKLAELFLSHTNVGDESIKLLAAAAKAGHLTNLAKFGVSHTKVGDEGVRHLAEAVKAGHLTNLAELGLSDTNVGDEGVRHLAEVAKAGHLTKLAALYLSHTSVGDEGVTHLAEAATAHYMMNLEVLDLSYTKVGDKGLLLLDAAAKSGHLTQLRGLDLRFTQVKCVDSMILDLCEVREIFETLRMGAVLREARAIVVGSAAVGKTWLRRRVFQNEIVSKAEARRETHDIDFVDPRRNIWKPKIPGAHAMGIYIQPHVWDFAGQLIAHGVHETFLANDGRTVCILVLDANRMPGSQKEHGEELGNRLDYWLRTIAHFAGEKVPVVIAITQCDDVGSESRRIDSPFPQLCVPVSQAIPDDLTNAFKANVVGIVDDCSACDSMRPIEPLRHMIEEAIGQLSSLNDAKVPRKLIPLRKKVEQELRYHPFVSRLQFTQWCATYEVGITDGDESDSYLRILHHMGSLFYFGLTDREQRERDREGADWLQQFPPGRQRLMRKELGRSLAEHIINPDWLKWVVYRLIRHSNEKPWISRTEIANQVADSDRRMSEAHINFVPNALGPAVVEEFLKLVDLSFYDEATGKYLFPRGLTGGPPPGTGRWDSSQMHWDYFPEAALHRFIVRMHARGQVVQEDGSDANWRNAVLIEHPKGNRTAVVGKPDEGILEIRFDPASAFSHRIETWRYIKDIFVNEFIGLEPTREIGTPSSESGGTGTNTAARPILRHEVDPVDPRLMSAIASPNLVLSTRKSEEQDAWRIQRVEAYATEVLGSLSQEDRQFVRSLFSLTRGDEFGGETGRIGFRAGYFFQCYLNEAVAVLKTRKQMTWEQVFEFLERRGLASQELPWDWFGNSDFKPKSFGSLRRNYSRSPESVIKVLDTINPYLERGRGPNHPVFRSP